MEIREKARKPQLLKVGGGESPGQGRDQGSWEQGRGGEERLGKSRDQRSWEYKETERDEMTVNLVVKCVLCWQFNHVCGLRAI